MRNNLSVINIYNKKNIKSKLVTQLLYGESFEVIKKSGKWIKIKNDSDGYKGFAMKKNFLNKEKNTHKVSILSAKLYSQPNFKIKKKLSFGSRIKVIEKKNNFYKFDNLWIKKKI